MKLLWGEQTNTKLMIRKETTKQFDNTGEEKESRYFSYYFLIVNVMVTLS